MGENNICGVLNLTVRCNHDCEFCCDGDVKDSGHHLTTDEAKAKIDDLATQGAGSVTLIGGEPTIRKDLTDLARYIKSKGMWTSLTTNGTLLGDGKLEELMDAGLSSLEISMHAVDPERSRQVSRRQFTPERHRALLDNLKKMPKQKRPGVAVNFVLYGSNIDQLVPMAKLISEEYSFVNEFFINFVDPIGFPALHPEMVPKYHEIEGLLEQAISIAVKAGLNTTMDNVPACIAGRHLNLIRTVRERTRGVQYSKSTFRITDSTPEDDTSQYSKINACRSCSMRAICPGVNFRYLKIHGPSGFRPMSFSPEMLSELVYPKGSEKQRLSSLMERLYAEQRELDQRKIAQLEVSTQCNNRCDGCQFICQMGKAQPRPQDELVKEMDQMVSDGIEILEITGPEPTIRAELAELLSQAASRFKTVILETNGRAMAYPRLAEKIAASGVNEVRIGLHAGYPGEHDRLTKVRGSFDQTVKGLENLRAHKKLHVTARLYLHETAADSWPKTLARLVKLGVVEVGLIPTKSWDNEWTPRIQALLKSAFISEKR
jgi:MoaA/NifB/PqqE/SkfB family radical SAM enzyme